MAWCQSVALLKMRSELDARCKIETGPHSVRHFACYCLFLRPDQKRKKRKEIISGETNNSHQTKQQTEQEIQIERDLENVYGDCGEEEGGGGIQVFWQQKLDQHLLL